MSKYLVSISIGPVQDFISAARKTADLCAGSDLLVQVVGRAAKVFDAEHGHERIFPVKAENGGANKILAVVNVGQDAESCTELCAELCAELCKRAKKAALNSLMTEWNKSCKSGHVRQDVAQQQIEHFLEFYAAWVPIQDDLSDYSKARKRVESLLSGRKALRDFGHFDQQDDGVPKSPLDPAFATVLKLKSGASGTVSDELCEFNKRYDLKPSEVLDGISLLKRAYGGRYTSGVLRTNELAQRAHEPEFCSSEEDHTPSQPYFAVLVADGDNMGKLLSKRDTVEAHKEISEQLDKFAGRANEIVEKHHGQPVYAGGDDVFAFLPVTSALSCGRELAEAFQDELGGDEVSLSAGIAIVHYKEPLSQSLRQARDAEKKAKQVDGKNALCVAVHTRGGAPFWLAAQWSPLVDRLQGFQEQMENHEIPRGVPYELRELAREWPASTENTENFAPDVLRLEAQRIADRKTRQDGSKGSVTIPELQSVKELRELADQLVLARFLSGKGEHHT